MKLTNEAEGILPKCRRRQNLEVVIQVHRVSEALRWKKHELICAATS